MSVDAPRFWEEVRLGEDTGLALKEAQFRGQQVSAPHRDGLADGLAAFANSGGGRLVLGVADDRKPQSLDPTRLDALANLVTEVCSDSVEPPLDFSLYRVGATPFCGTIMPRPAFRQVAEGQKANVGGRGHSVNS